MPLPKHATRAHPLQPSQPSLYTASLPLPGVTLLWSPAAAIQTHTNNKHASVCACMKSIYARTHTHILNEQSEK